MNFQRVSENLIPKVRGFPVVLLSETWNLRPEAFRLQRVPSKILSKMKLQVVSVFHRNFINLIEIFFQLDATIESVKFNMGRLKFSSFSDPRSNLSFEDAEIQSNLRVYNDKHLNRIYCRKSDSNGNSKSNFPSSKLQKFTTTITFIEFLTRLTDHSIFKFFLAGCQEFDKAASLSQQLVRSIFVRIWKGNRTKICFALDEEWSLIHRSCISARPASTASDD